jgi:hypothetical protein
MSRPRKGIIYSLEEVLAQLMKTNEKLDQRLAQMEAILIGSAAPAQRGRKPGRKPGGKAKTGKSCSVPGCKRDHYAKGLCASHSQTAHRKQTEKKLDK